MKFGAERIKNNKAQKENPRNNIFGKFFNLMLARDISNTIHFKHYIKKIMRVLCVM